MSVLERTGWAPVACVIAIVAAMALVGLVGGASSSGDRAHAEVRAEGAVPGRAVGSVPSRGVVPGRNVGVVPSTPPGASGAIPVADIISPARIEIPRLRATAPIVDVGTTADHELDVPLDPHTVGWWKYGAKPGAAVGTAILAGHVNYAGVTGAMAAIGTLDPGDEVDVYGQQNAAAKHEVRFRVTGVRTYHKTRLPYQQIFDQKSVGRIAIVTCGGPFDSSTGNYLDNIVVFAVPMDAGQRSG